MQSLNISTTVILDQMTSVVFVIGVGLCIGRCLMASLASTHSMQIASLTMWQPNRSLETAKCHLKGKHAQIENKGFQKENSENK